MTMVASLIIPTHNRSASIQNLLTSLNQQSFAKGNFEVIVVADGCTDDTAAVISTLPLNYQLSITETSGVGAAGARNAGAELATGKWLIFIDDDMEVCENFIAEHIVAHSNDETVVIGYSPMKLESKEGIQRIALREWWEEKFQSMRESGYCFKYSDLTSGNFSISNILFKKLNGFNTDFFCREDYELGFRLIECGVPFRFAYKAKAFHCDNVTNLRRSFQRKKAEGMADVLFKKLHPQFFNEELFIYLHHRGLYKSVFLRIIQYVPFITDAFARGYEFLMNYFEQFKMRSYWLKANSDLHQYWYVRGLIKELHSSKKMRQLFDKVEKNSNKKELQIDLTSGFEKIETQLNEMQPEKLSIIFDKNFIADIERTSGSGPIKISHLKKILRENFFTQLYSALEKKDVE